MYRRPPPIFSGGGGTSVRRLKFAVWRFSLVGVCPLDDTPLDIICRVIVLEVLCHVSVSLCYFSFRSFRKHRHKSPAVYILSPALHGLWRENSGSVNRLLLSSCFKIALTGRKGVACSRLSDSGEDVKVKGTQKVGSFLPFYFCRAFSIQQARLSRSPEQVRKAVAMYSKCEHNTILCQHPGTGSWTPSVDSS